MSTINEDQQRNVNGTHHSHQARVAHDSENDNVPRDRAKRRHKKHTHKKAKHEERKDKTRRRKSAKGGKDADITSKINHSRRKKRKKSTRRSSSLDSSAGARQKRKRGRQAFEACSEAGDRNDSNSACAGLQAFIPSALEKTNSEAPARQLGSAAKSRNTTDFPEGTRKDKVAEGEERKEMEPNAARARAMIPMRPEEYQARQETVREVSKGSVVYCDL